MQNTSSHFPSEIDNRIFFQDVNLSQLDVKAEFEKLLNEKNYTQASSYIGNSNVNYYGAWLLNLLENRLVNIEDFLKDETKPHLVDYDVQPTTEGMHWISD